MSVESLTLTDSHSMKPFYRDSLIDLRRVLYLLLQRSLKAWSNYPALPAPELRAASGEPTSSANPRVVIVTRNATLPLSDASRRLTRRSEQLLLTAFRERGASAVICCDFSIVDSVPKLLSYFGHMDICVGIHGAGLSNCILGKEG